MHFKFPKAILSTFYLPVEKHQHHPGSRPV
jgi:hypothetical protein